MRGTSLLHFFENWKKVPWFWEKVKRCTDFGHLCLKFLKRVIFLWILWNFQERIFMERHRWLHLDITLKKNKIILSSFSLLLFAVGSSKKDFHTNLEIFGKLPSPCPGLFKFGCSPPHPVRLDTRLALFETLQLVNNSHWRVKKLIILFENNLKNIRMKTIFMSLHCVPYILHWIQAEWKFYIQTNCQIIWVNFTNTIAIIFFLYWPIPMLPEKRSKEHHENAIFINF